MSVSRFPGDGGECAFWIGCVHGNARNENSTM